LYIGVTYINPQGNHNTKLNGLPAVPGVTYINLKKESQSTSITLPTFLGVTYINPQGNHNPPLATD
jgi:hypothetical protein